MRFARRRPALLVLAAFVLVACGGGGPRPIVAGQDACEYCRMTISDVRFGGELMTATGRIHTFDSVECLAGYVAAAGDSLQTRGIWVSDFATSSLIPADDARFLMNGSIRSPMGRKVASFGANNDAGSLLATYGGTLLTWNEMVALARSNGFASLHGEHSAPRPNRGDEFVPAA